MMAMRGNASALPFPLLASRARPPARASGQRYRRVSGFQLQVDQKRTKTKITN